MASIEEAAAGLSHALTTGNAQDADAAQALYAEALGDDDPADFELGPAKRDLAGEAVPEELLDEGELFAVDQETLADAEASDEQAAVQAEASVDAENEGLVILDEDES